MILANPPLREELAAVTRLGIAHSHFLGGPNAWTDLDRAKVLAFLRIERQTCVCGTRPDEWAADPDAYTWQHTVCEGCARLAQGREAAEDSDVKGLQVGLVPLDQVRVEDD